jgi:hypothetical protein
VSRRRLLASRAAFGLLLTAGVNVFMVITTWLLFPLVRGTSTPIDLLLLLLAGIACVTDFYFVAVFVATLLDDIWQLYVSMAAVGAAWWVSSKLPLPASFDVFRVMSDASPLRTHTLPWPAMILSLVASALLLLAALKVVETHEY